jgi:signal transduction histidine kinase
LNNDLSSGTAQWWGVFCQTVALFIPSTWLHFVLVYTGLERKYQKALYGIYACTFLIFPFTFSKQFVIGFRPIAQFLNYPIPGMVYHVFTALFVIVVSLSFLIFWQAIIGASTEKKKDFRFVCFASLYGFVTGSLSLLPIYGIPLNQYNLLAMPLWQILLTYGMIRFQMFDVEEFAKAAHKDKLAAIGTLATSLNHEIKNPLYIIRGFAESYLEHLKEGNYKTPEDALKKSQEILTKTVDQANRAMEIMRRFSMFAKQSVNDEAQLEDVSLERVLDDIVPLVNHELELDKIQLVRQIPKGFLPIRADCRHIEEILFNLIVNSCQAMKEGGEIRISAAQQNGYACVTIEDTGPGIAPERLKQIFEPFYTTKQEGTGLGLYVVKQLVERNNGKISVKSKMGKGTNFLLEFKR